MPDFEAQGIVLVTDSPDATQQLGETLGRLLEPGDLICLQGELGAGKTTLTTGIARGWGALETVNSPTFVFVNAYSRPHGDRLYHVDAYRLRNAADADSIGLDDLLNERDAAVLVEWPERVLAALPEEALWVALTGQAENTRQIMVTAKGSRAQALLKGLRGL